MIKPFLTGYHLGRIPLKIEKQLEVEIKIKQMFKIRFLAKPVKELKSVHSFTYLRTEHFNLNIFNCLSLVTDIPEPIY